MRRIVIIDDEPDFAETLRTMLSTLSYETVIATDANYANELNDDDIVFLDILMPDTSGLQILDQLAEQDSNCAIILMSGNLEQLEGGEKYAESLDLNLLGALEKPFRLADVQEVLDGT